MRIGVHTGPISAGIVGTRKYMFDCFGDTVNVASRMESTGIAGRVQVSRATYERTYDFFTFKERTGVEAKGKGTVNTYIVDMDLKDMEKDFLNTAATPMTTTPERPDGPSPTLQETGPSPRLFAAHVQTPRSATTSPRVTSPGSKASTTAVQLL